MKLGARKKGGTERENDAIVRLGEGKVDRQTHHQLKVHDLSDLISSRAFARRTSLRFVL